MIREVRREDIPECVNVIKKSFQTVADEFGITVLNAPRFTAFATTEERLFHQFDNEHRPMFVFCENDIICGFYSLFIQNENECELNNLAVLPEYRHKGIGKSLFDHSVKTAGEIGFNTLNIGIVEENRVLKKWYEKNGAIHIGTQKYDFFPFTCGYMKKSVNTDLYYNA
ncbi:MAG: GNAT family N-acetyltransferase [Huintestinicola sp.]